MASVIAGLLACLAAPVFAQTSECSLGVDNKSVLVDATFDTVARTAMPSTVSVSAPIIGQCSPSASLPKGVYRWTLNPKAISFVMVSGTTAKRVVDAVGRKISVASTTIEVNNGPPGYTAKYQAADATTATLSGLSSQLSVGQYRLSQAFEVKQEFCQWTGTDLACRADGGKRNFTAYYTLTVVESPPQQPTSAPPPATTESTPGAAAGHGIKPNPLTVRGAMLKYRCEI